MDDTLKLWDPTNLNKPLHTASGLDCVIEVESVCVGKMFVCVCVCVPYVCFSRDSVSESDVRVLLADSKALATRAMDDTLKL